MLVLKITSFYVIKDSRTFFEVVVVVVVVVVAVAVAAVAVAAAAVAVVVVVAVVPVDSQVWIFPALRSRLPLRRVSVCVYVIVRKGSLSITPGSWQRRRVIQDSTSQMVVASPLTKMPLSSLQENHQLLDPFLAPAFFPRLECEQDFRSWRRFDGGAC